MKQRHHPLLLDDLPLRNSQELPFANGDLREPLGLSPPSTHRSNASVLLGPSLPYSFIETDSETLSTAAVMMETV